MIISCPECKGQVSTTAASCPHCGAPNQGTWTSIDERPIAPPLSPTPPPAIVHNISVEEKPRLWRRMMRRPPRVTVMSQPSRQALDRIITPGRTFQHGAAGGFGLSFGWVLGGCVANVVIGLTVIGVAFGGYAYYVRRSTMFVEPGPPVPMEKKIHNASVQCARCNGVGYLEAQGNRLGIKCPKCGGSGLSQ